MSRLDLLFGKKNKKEIKENDNHSSYDMQHLANTHMKRIEPKFSSKTPFPPTPQEQYTHPQYHQNPYLRENIQQSAPSFEDHPKFAPASREDPYHQPAFNNDFEFEYPQYNEPYPPEQNQNYSMNPYLEHKLHDVQKSHVRSPNHEMHASYPLREEQEEHNDYYYHSPEDSNPMNYAENTSAPHYNHHYNEHTQYHEPNFAPQYKIPQDYQGQQPISPYGVPPASSNRHRYQPQLNTESFQSQNPQYNPHYHPHHQNNLYKTPGDETSKFYGSFRYIVSITGLIFVTAITWTIYRWISQPNSDAPVYITASANPFKIRPDNPGGADFPYQDKLVYDRLLPNNVGQNAPIERLLPEPETVIIQPPAAYHQPDVNQSYNGQSQPYPGPVQPGTEATQPMSYNQNSPHSSEHYPEGYTAPFVQKENPLHNAQQNQTQDPMSQAPVQTIKQNPTLNSAQNPALFSPAEQRFAHQDTSMPLKPTGPTYVLQLGTLTSEEKARSEKKRLQRKYHNILSQEFIIKPRNSNNKIIYSLVTSQYFNSKKEAQDMCRKLGGACKPIAQ